MKNFKNQLTNRKKIIFIFIAVFILLTTSSVLLINLNNKNVKLLSTAEENIKLSKYDDALEILQSINEEKDLSLKEKVNTYTSILSFYKSINLEEKKDILKEELNNFINTYKDTLSFDIFNIIYNDINSYLLDIENYYTKLDEDKNSVLNTIDDDVEKSEELLASLKTTYLNEDFSDLEKAINDKKAKIQEEIKAEEERLAKEEEERLAKEEAERLAEEEKLAESDKTSSENSPSNNSSNTPLSTAKIANTSAAKNSSQLITVVSNGGASAELTMWQKDSNGSWYEYDSTYAYLGSGGMKSASLVYEMDMCTPTGNYSLTEAFGNCSNPGTSISYRVLDGSEHWIDDENSPYYNTMQFGDANGRWTSSEHLSTFGKAYNYSIVIDYNRWPVVPGKSSAIFLHVSTGSPTWGCVAIDESKMIKLLQWINPSSNPRILLDFSYENIYNNY